MTDVKKVVSMIDHTLLKTECTTDQIKKLCLEAKQHVFASVCVPPAHVALAARELADSQVLVCTVVGFPLGYQLSSTKAQETTACIELGADEIDMVINISALKSGNYELVLSDIEAVVTAAGDKCVKVILETCLLSDQEIVKACELCTKARATFVKTSTGFSTAGATTAHVKLMKNSISDQMKVKASGGVKTMEDALSMIEAGADRLGTSSGVAIANN